MKSPQIAGVILIAIIICNIEVANCSDNNPIDRKFQRTNARRKRYALPDEAVLSSDPNAVYPMPNQNQYPRAAADPRVYPPRQPAPGDEYADPQYSQGYSDLGAAPQIEYPYDEEEGYDPRHISATGASRRKGSRLPEQRNDLVAKYTDTTLSKAIVAACSGLCCSAVVSLLLNVRIALLLSLHVSCMYPINARKTFS
jgi:hypothetical protein